MPPHNAGVLPPASSLRWCSAKVTHTSTTSLRRPRDRRGLCRRRRGAQPPLLGARVHSGFLRAENHLDDVDEERQVASVCGGCSSVGRALDCDSGCRGFEPRQSPHSCPRIVSSREPDDLRPSGGRDVVWSGRRRFRSCRRRRMGCQRWPAVPPLRTAPCPRGSMGLQGPSVAAPTGNGPARARGAPSKASTATRRERATANGTVRPYGRRDPSPATTMISASRDTGMCFSGGSCSAHSTWAMPDVGPHPDAASRAGVARESECKTMATPHWSLGIKRRRAHVSTGRRPPSHGPSTPTAPRCTCRAGRVRRRPENVGGHASPPAVTTSASTTHQNRALGR